MSDSATYGGYGGFGAAMTRDQTRSLFSQTMGYVALTAALFAAGAYLGRELSYGLGWVWFIAAFACLIAMNFTVRRSLQLTVVLAGRIRRADRAGDGARRSPTTRARIPARCGRPAARPPCSSPDSAPQDTRPGAICRRSRGSASSRCIGLIVFGIVMIFVRIPHGNLIYSVIGLVIFAGFTMFDFQRLRTSKDIRSAPLLAASIFLDILNVFLFFLRIFSRSN